jgi:hypothetical protein
MPAMSGYLAATVGQFWADFLAFVEGIVSPDWGALVLLIPLALAPLVLLHLVMSGGAWTLHWLTKPRPRVRWEEGPRPLERDGDGNPALPLGLPFSLRAGLVYPAGTVRADDGEDLVVICPACRVQRPAQVPACGNCGLVLSLRRGMTVARPMGPPPGGAASA